MFFLVAFIKFPSIIVCNDNTLYVQNKLGPTMLRRNRAITIYVKSAKIFSNVNWLATFLPKVCKQRAKQLSACNLYNKI
jgi:hypothetical protein